MPVRGFLHILLIALAVAPARAEITLVSTGAVWKFFDSGASPGNGWQLPEFDDSGWVSGAAQLGWGDGDEGTMLAPGANKPITVYFRTTFTNPRVGYFTTLTLRLLRDDGAMVYLNGAEIFRSNLPGGAVGSATPAVSNNESEENRFVQAGLSPYLLLPGTNLIAVEVHQAAGGTNDCSFDLELVADLPLTPPAVTILSPTNGSLFEPGEISISAAASDLDGHIDVVSFFVGTNWIGEARSEPYRLFWDALPGRYALRAEAIDNSGRRTSSSVVHLQVGDVEGFTVVRGPYLQLGTPTSVVIRWRTDWLADSRVVYGLNPAILTLATSDPLLTTEHEVRLSGLTPDTTYYYAIGTSTELLAGGAGYSLVTSATNAKPTRVWVIGDSGTATTNAWNVRDRFMQYSSDRRAALWLMLGDNAYEEGTDQQYQAAVFGSYPEMLRSTVVWPTIGNHDAALPDANGRIAFHDLFTLPTQGEAGGLPSGTENYYAFDYGNIHFVCLDSSISDRSPESPMLTWLRNDLAATDKDWIIAYWHHPPYTYGTHYSDSESELIQMRQNALPILESYGVDLVLCGHSHVYERSFLLNGHYGHSGTLTPSMVLDAGNGRADGDGAYAKPAGGLGANLGTVYVVCGCSGEGGVGTFVRHPAMAYNLGGFGSLVLDIDGLSLTVRFLRDLSGIDDYFTIQKGPAGPGVTPRLEISRSGGVARIEWPTSLDPYELEATLGLGPVWTWQATTNIPVQWGRRNRVTLPMEPPNRVFRLRSVP